MFWDFLLGLFTTFTPLSPAPSLPANAPPVDSAQATALASDRVPFSVHFGQDQSDYRVMAMFVLPNQAVPVAVDIVPRVADQALGYQLIAGAGVTEREPGGGWTWTAPKDPGLYPVEVREPATGQTMTLNVFVMVPYSAMKHGRLHGYRIGNYPRTRAGYEAEYARPRGFVEVRPELLDAQVSPHFRLGQFLCKQGDAFPQYLVLRSALFPKLEELLARVNQAGYDVATLSVMSAYRTPFYNRSIGNVTTFSRHLYGDAADVFVDADGDGVMDDLNHDGRHTLADAQVLQALVRETVEAEPASFAGGLGIYPPTHEHGPFVHVDVRGFDVEWAG